MASRKLCYGTDARCINGAVCPSISKIPPHAAAAYAVLIRPRVSSAVACLNNVFDRFQGSRDMAYFHHVCYVLWFFARPRWRGVCMIAVLFAEKIGGEMSSCM
jgi:hypothetical protein